jgi:hypothetical protein
MKLRFALYSTALLAACSPELAPAGEEAPMSVDPAPAGQTALFNSFEDAVECSRCGGRMIRTGACYTCRDCGTNTGCG